MMNRQVGEKIVPHRHGWQVALIVATTLCVALWLATAGVAFAQGTYDYTVQEGDSWDTVAETTGVDVEALKEANPEAAERESGWLILGETLAIPNTATPAAPAAPAAPQRTHTVQAGESWN